MNRWFDRRVYVYMGNYSSWVDLDKMMTFFVGGEIDFLLRSESSAVIVTGIVTAVDRGPNGVAVCVEPIDEAVVRLRKLANTPWMGCVCRL